MGKVGQIDLYIDCNSPWSWYAYTHLRRNRQALEAYDVGVIVHPIFLGGLNVGSGNKPPWTLPAKAKYGSHDGPRATKYFKMPAVKPPPFFPIMSLLPMRCMLFTKDHYPYQQYEDCFGELWQMLWVEHQDDDAEKILKGGTDPKYKKMLTDETAMLVEKGAFGAPWHQVTNKHGVEEPFFGSDRYHFMWQFLNVSFQDIAILPPAAQSESKL
ncbi:hypothetical protein AC579_1521 [Pseudocercospora musae]|uniref:DSBA-like thioredoxin domain-containing protein n=1 Tax=Pseudocercospora musae TaxID=113226 RepID=A0A139ILW8_9PEZI|nr:hypothetical protein AC579_1521 [Pseudocercospora musae]